MRISNRLAPLAALLALASCSRQAPAPGAEAAKSPPPAAAPAEVPRKADRPTVVFLGDSLTAGLGLEESEAYPALVGEALAARGLPVRVVNAGVSGDTSAGGLARLDWLLTQRPAIVVVALGANDGMRAQPLPAIEATLREIVQRTRASGARVLLAGMRMPPNYGPEYTRGFEAIYPRLAEELEVPLLPFLLEGVAADPKLNQTDGIHPTAEGQQRIAASVTAALEPLVRGVVSGTAG